jgi:predicted deacylase
LGCAKIKIVKKLGIAVILLIALFMIVNSADAYEVHTIKWNTQGDISKNKILYKNIPKSALTTKIIKESKKGTVILKFGNKKGNKTLIVAGVHGNELSSQVAAFKLVNKLKINEKKLKGIVYVIPVLVPKSTQNSQRFFKGYNLNKVANKKGSVTYELIKKIKKYKINAVGDFHCSRPGGVPGKDVALGTYLPCKKSGKMAIAISKMTRLSYINEKYAAVSYPGALEDNLNLQMVPAVTCEVKTPHGTIAKGSVSKSYNMMIAFLKFNKQWS